MAALLVVTGCAACGTPDSDLEAAAAGEASHGVPGVVDQNGDEAVSSLEVEDLTAIFNDVDGRPLESLSSLDACRVTDQEPAGGAPRPQNGEVTLTLDCAQRDWDDQIGEVWDKFNDGFSAGFAAGCAQLFTLSPDGALYAGDFKYTEVDCNDLSPGNAFGAEYPRKAPAKPHEAGFDLGFKSGCGAIFEEDVLDELHHGELTFTARDCVRAAPSEPSGKPCPPVDLGGQMARIEPTGGDVACEGAIALWRQYLQSAPQGGAMTLGDWQCVAAPEAERPRLGSCKTDSGDAFAVAAV